jgi:hypothetical protein
MSATDANDAVAFLGAEWLAAAPDATCLRYPTNRLTIAVHQVVDVLVCRCHEMRHGT